MLRDKDFLEPEDDFQDDFRDEEYDSTMWDVENRDLEKFEYNTVNVLEEMKKDRAKLLHYGEQYDTLPHIRCYQCGKIIGDLWEPYLEYSNEKYFNPEDIIDLLPLEDEDKKDLFLTLGTPDFFVLLNEFNVKSDYDILKEQRKYTNEQIFNKLGGDLLLPKDEMNELIEALSDIRRFRELLLYHNLDGEYNEIMRVKVINDLYNKPLLSPELIEELFQNIDKPRKFQSLLQKNFVKDKIDINLNVANRVLGDMFEQGYITEEEYDELTDIIFGKLETEVSSIKPDKDKLVSVSTKKRNNKKEEKSDILRNLSKILTKMRKHKIYDAKVNEYITRKLSEITILNQIQQRNLMSFKNKPDKFQETLDKYGISQIFHNTIKEQGYESSFKILEKLGGKLLRPCCRMNLLSPIHIPIQQEAFEEAVKTIQIPNILADFQSTPVPVSIPEVTEDVQEISEYEFDTIPTPLMVPSRDTLDIGEIVIPNKVAIPLTQLKKIEDSELDDDIEDIGETGSGRTDQVYVGADRTVTRKSREYFAI